MNYKERYLLGKSALSAVRSKRLQKWRILRVIMVHRLQLRWDSTAPCIAKRGGVTLPLPSAVIYARTHSLLLLLLL